MCADGQWAGVHQILRARQTQRDGSDTVPKSTLRKRNSTQARSVHIRRGTTAKWKEVTAKTMSVSTPNAASTASPIYKNN